MKIEDQLSSRMMEHESSQAKITSEKKFQDTIKKTCDHVIKTHDLKSNQEGKKEAKDVLIQLLTDSIEKDQIGFFTDFIDKTNVNVETSTIIGDKISKNIFEELKKINADKNISSIEWNIKRIWILSDTYRRLIFCLKNVKHVLFDPQTNDLLFYRHDRNLTNSRNPNIDWEWYVVLDVSNDKFQTQLKLLQESDINTNLLIKDEDISVLHYIKNKDNDIDADQFDALFLTDDNDKYNSKLNELYWIIKLGSRFDYERIKYLLNKQYEPILKLNHPYSDISIRYELRLLRESMYLSTKWWWDLWMFSFQAYVNMLKYTIKNARYVSYYGHKESDGKSKGTVHLHFNEWDFIDESKYSIIDQLIDNQSFHKEFSASNKQLLPLWINEQLFPLWMKVDLEYLMDYIDEHIWSEEAFVSKAFNYLLPNVLWLSSDSITSFYKSLYKRLSGIFKDAWLNNHILEKNMLFRIALKDVTMNWKAYIVKELIRDLMKMYLYIELDKNLKLLKNTHSTYA